jgi:O-antigen/teichoic acid export membrane protein
VILSSRLASTALRGTLIVLIGQALTFILNFLTQRLINTSLSLTDNGTFFLIQRISELALIICVEAGLYNIVLRMLIAQDKHDQVLLTRSFFQLRFVLWLLTSIIVTVVLHAVYGVLPIATILWCVSYGFGARTLILRPILESQWRMQSQFFLPTILSVIESAMVLVCLATDTYILAPQFGRVRGSFIGIEHIAGWYMVIASSGFFVTLLLTKQWFIFSPRVSWHHIRIILSAGLPMVVSVILLQITDKFDSLLLETLHGRDILGVLGVIMRATTPLNVLLIAILTGIFPTLVQVHLRSAERAQEIFYKLLHLSFLGGIAGAVFLSICSPLIGTILAGEFFARYAHELWCAFWVLPLSFVIQMLIGVQTAFGNQRFNARLTVAWCLLTCVLAYPSILWGDIIGVFAGRIAVYTVLALGGCWSVHRIFISEQVPAKSKHIHHRQLLMLVVRLMLMYGTSMAISWYCMHSFSLFMGLGVGISWLVCGTFLLRLISPAMVKEIRLLLRHSDESSSS